MKVMGPPRGGPYISPMGPRSTPPLGAREATRRTPRERPSRVPGCREVPMGWPGITGSPTCSRCSLKSLWRTAHHNNARTASACDSKIQIPRDSPASTKRRKIKSPAPAGPRAAGRRPGPPGLRPPSGPAWTSESGNRRSPTLPELSECPEGSPPPRTPRPSHPPETKIACEIKKTFMIKVPSNAMRPARRGQTPRCSTAFCTQYGCSGDGKGIRLGTSHSVPLSGQPSR